MLTYEILADHRIKRETKQLLVKTVMCSVNLIETNTWTAIVILCLEATHGPVNGEGSLCYVITPVLLQMPTERANWHTLHLSVNIQLIIVVQL